MGKDLFGDLDSNIEEKYLKYNDETTLKEFALYLDNEIQYLENAPKDIRWAERVFAIHKKLDDDKKLLNAVKNSIMLRGYLFIAESIIEVEQDLRKEEEQKRLKEQECIKNENEAKQIDDILVMLIDATSRDIFWC